MPVYLDNNATTALDPRVLDAMLPFLKDIHGNPSSVHRYGRLTRNAVEHARMQVAQLVAASPEQVIFTSGGTEANNLAILGSLSNKQPSQLAISAIEHASVTEPARTLTRQGWELDYINVDADGRLDEDSFRSTVSDQTALLSVMLANNETGSLQPVQELAQQLADKQLLFHSDASQVAGKLAINFTDLGIDMMTLSSHKFYGPQGAGALIAKRSIELEPVIHGGGQERGLRNGTENIPAIVGFGAAAELARLELEQNSQHSEILKQQLLSELNRIQGLTLFSQLHESLPNTIQFALENFDGEALLMYLDKQGIAVSSGSACHSQAGAPSHVLLAMGVSPELAKNAIRVSFGKNNQTDDVSVFIKALKEITLSSPQSMCAG
ncbi:MAG: cysteine desulfurase [Gammaproteobacteria bacterium]|nr:cysteine desulfurase [Gammaproteobacteria bacterium]